MQSKRYPLIFFIGGAAVKTFLIGLWRVTPSPELFHLLTDYDPGAFAFANCGSSLFFDPRRIAPVPGEAMIFEILLVIGFGFECLLIGLLVRWLRPSAKKSANARSHDGGKHNRSNERS